MQGTLEYHGDMGLPADRYPAITAEMRDKARRVVGGTSDLASVPRFLRWFENTYGRHTPAALIHDNLIGPTPNRGPLENDAASDRFFRYMLEAVGVPFFKRWIMWAAVAFRTRWAVGGWRRRSVAAWVILAALGITAFVWAVVAIATGNDGPGGLDHWAFLGLALGGADRRHPPLGQAVGRQPGHGGRRAVRAAAGRHRCHRLRPLLAARAAGAGPAPLIPGCGSLTP